MSGVIYLVALAAVGWLGLWTIRDPKEPKWDWWPIDWWPFDTQAEAEAQQAAEHARQEGVRGRRVVPWRERRAVGLRNQRANASRRGH
jgi:hypothetical protein